METRPRDVVCSPVGRRVFLTVLGAGAVGACGGTGMAIGSGTPDGSFPPDGSTVPDGVSVTDGVAVTDSTVPTDSDASTNDVPATCTLGDDFGAVTDFAVGRYVLASATLQIIIGRDTQGLYAYSASCTHTGCTLPAPAGISGVSVCPCHGSRFDSNGVVQPGSVALRDLPHFALAVCAGRVVVDRFTTVAADTRFAV